MPRFGVDHSSTPPDPALLKQHHVSFVCRYLSTPGNPKNITAREAAGLRSHGIDVVLVFETVADRALAGRGAGAADAAAARGQSVPLGLDAAPIYFAVDFDADETQQALVGAYLDGAVSVLGWRNVGVYGGYRVVQRSLDAKKCRYAWQTYAWSGGRWDGRAQIRQYVNGEKFCGINCDFDRAVATDFGQAHPPVIRKVSNLVRRHRLRALLVARRRHGASWATLKASANWKLWRRLGGR